MWVQEKMVLKRMLFENILLHVQGLNCGEDIYELKHHVGQESSNSNLLLKFGIVKKIPLARFPNRLLKSV
jgi:hypothetical protein